MDFVRLNDYIICYDLLEAITGDITKFEGVSDEQIRNVTNKAIEYLSNCFKSVIDLEMVLNN